LTGDVAEGLFVGLLEECFVERLMIETIDEDEMIDYRAKNMQYFKSNKMQDIIHDSSGEEVWLKSVCQLPTTNIVLTNSIRYS
jgi:hypothetical protein